MSHCFYWNFILNLHTKFKAILAFYLCDGNVYQEGIVENCLEGTTSMRTEILGAPSKTYSSFEIGLRLVGL